MSNGHSEPLDVSRTTNRVRCCEPGCIDEQFLLQYDQLDQADTSQTGIAGGAVVVAVVDRGVVVVGGGVGGSGVGGNGVGGTTPLSRSTSTIVNERNCAPLFGVLRDE